MQAATPTVTFTVTNIGEALTAGLPALSLTAGTFLDAGDCGTTRLTGTGGGTCPAASVCSCTATVSVLGNLARMRMVLLRWALVDQTAAPGETSDETFAVTVKVVSPALVTITPATNDFSPAGSGTYVGAEIASR